MVQALGPRFYVLCCRQFHKYNKTDTGTLHKFMRRN